MGVLDDVAKAAKNAKTKIDQGNDETSGLGRELADKARNIQASGVGTSAPTPAAPPVKSAPKIDTGKRYGDKSGEKKPADMGFDVNEAMKPLGKLHTGTPYVPKTGNYLLEKGEAVTPKDKNMNSADAMAGLTPKAKPPKKIHKITTHKTDDGKMIHTHQHHHSVHHPDETHVSNNMDEMNQHMADNMPNMAAQPPAMSETGAAPAGAAPTGM